jgi:serine/threonine-protein kinase
VILGADTTVTATFALKTSVCVVPNVVKKTLVAAKTAITAGRCGVGTISYATSPSIAKGKVISQSSQAGMALKKGAKLNLVVSKGPH